MRFRPCLFVCLFVSLFVCVFVSLFVCVFVCLFACLFVCVSCWKAGSGKPNKPVACGSACPCDKAFLLSPVMPESSFRGVCEPDTSLDRSCFLHCIQYHRVCVYIYGESERERERARESEREREREIETDRDSGSDNPQYQFEVCLRHMTLYSYRTRNMAPSIVGTSQFALWTI